MYKKLSKYSDFLQRIPKEGEQLKKYVGIEQVKFHWIVNFFNYVLKQCKEWLLVEEFRQKYE